MAELMKYLISMNHKHIAYITGEDCYVTRARLKAYTSCLKEADIPVDTEYMKQGIFRNINTSAYLTEELLRLPNPPSCIIYPDDYAAIGGINVLRARGLDVPNDISIAGYDGIDILAVYEPRITTVVQNKSEIGSQAAYKMMEWINNPEKVIKDTVVIKTELQKGHSVSKRYY